MPDLVVELTKNTGFCDVEKVFRKDSAFYEILKPCGTSRGISTSASKQELSTCGEIYLSKYEIISLIVLLSTFSH